MVIANFIPRAEIIPLSGRFRIRVACVRRYRVRINAEGGVETWGLKERGEQIEWRMYLHYIIELNADNAQGSRNRSETEIVQGIELLSKRRRMSRIT